MGISQDDKEIEKKPNYNKFQKRLALFFYYSLCRHLPDISPNRLGKTMRRNLCKIIFKKCGTNINIESGVFFGSGINIEIGSHSGIGRSCYIAGIGGGGKLIIGDYVMIAPEVVILTLAHKFEDLKSVRGAYNSTTVKIGDYAWIGLRSIILPGVSIGEYAIVGAGSVVTKDVPSYAVVGGVPARVLKDRRFEKQMEYPTI